VDLGRAFKWFKLNYYLLAFDMPQLFAQMLLYLLVDLGVEVEVLLLTFPGGTMSRRVLFRYWGRRSLLAAYDRLFLVLYYWVVIHDLVESLSVVDFPLVQQQTPEVRAA
jgi:hypothetical protein